MNHTLAYLLFIKMYKKDLITKAAYYITHETPLTEDEKKRLLTVCISFIQFLSNEFKQYELNAHAIEYWIQIHRQTIKKGNERYFLHATQYALIHVLDETNGSNRDKILEMNDEIVQQALTFIQKWHQLTLYEEDSHYFNEQFDLFNLELIKSNGTEDLTYLLIRIEEIFHFKRCMFFSYNPWLEEFSGAIGAEPDKIRLMKGKIALEPVFAMKKPVYLHSPAPYIQQIAIDLFTLSSILFIPVQYGNTLYGWISLDQQGQPFECTLDELKRYEQVGIRLAMYLSRKQLGTKMNYDLALSEKERVILHLLAEGFSNKDMAQLLYSSEFTIRDHIQSLFQKLQAKNRTHLITTAFRMGIVD
jgi:DNA-binding CsgD family transcriptional regulator